MEGGQRRRLAESEDELILKIIITSHSHGIRMQGYKRGSLKLDMKKQQEECKLEEFN